MLNSRLFTRSVARLLEDLKKGVSFSTKCFVELNGHLDSVESRVAATAVVPSQLFGYQVMLVSANVGLVSIYVCMAVFI